MESNESSGSQGSAEAKDSAGPRDPAADEAPEFFVQTLADVGPGLSCLLPPWWGVLRPDRPLEPQTRRAAQRLLAAVSPDQPVTVAQRTALAEELAAGLHDLDELGYLTLLYEAEPLEGVPTGFTAAVVPTLPLEGMRPIDTVLALASLGQWKVTVVEETEDRVAVRLLTVGKIDEERELVLTEALAQAGAPPEQAAVLISLLRAWDLTYVVGDPRAQADAWQGWLTMVCQFQGLSTEGVAAAEDSEIPDDAADGAADRGDGAEPADGTERSEEIGSAARDSRGGNGEPASEADQGDRAEPADGTEPIVDLGWAMIALCDQVARSLEFELGSGADDAMMRRSG